ncbi:MAG: hypothetical protein M3N29_00555 [Chloroflexota bacterium]|nr:hypothetical protein [Chloroflexota bacterium]
MDERSRENVAEPEAETYMGNQTLDADEGRLSSDQLSRRSDAEDEQPDEREVNPEASTYGAP